MRVQMYESDVRESALVSGHSATEDLEAPQAKRRKKKDRREELSFGSVRMGTLQNAACHATAVSDMDALLPTTGDGGTLPHCRLGRYSFAVRLGVYLADNALLPMGMHPEADNDEVVIHTCANITSPSGKHVIRADPSFRGKPAYSFVEIQADDDHWYAQLLLLFVYRCDEDAGPGALVAYLKKAPELERVCPNKSAFRWYSRFPYCVDVRQIVRPVWMVHVNWLSRRDDPVFVLVDM